MTADSEQSVPGTAGDPGPGTATVTEESAGTGATGADEASAAPGTPEAGAEAGEAPDPETAPWSGPAMWVVPALVAALGAVCLWGAFTVEAPPNVTRPGPAAFPGAVGGLLLLVAACLSAVNVRNLRSGAVSGANGLAWFEGRPVLLILAGLVVHIAVLEHVGWLLSGALLFWVVAYAFGARAHVRDAVVALSMSAAVQVGFSLGLGLSLPGGFLELVL
ncbi:tripartite tricarboxylate transporter TctB family protein [Nocardiopsis tropica]|uniref:Tripartite tricarboxylate transporter TctB family protein n=1 Tax=Nocardiopsis tropica TaxID=109330 RepID=A0ABU7L0J6_9ACTN|nr:tripartite tricarboxylate transporter TctB family protein [Nocardiopsis umidischolae]MEE2055075.1 tripartite tricarboxylate transporter TctB family protein [Nocardiopsis umidischolae]